MLTLFTRVRIIILTAIFVMAVVTVVPALSATVTSISDVPANQDAGAVSNHTLSFTTPSGASEGDTITITFDASFDTSSLTEDDIDIADDGGDLTTAVDCSGAEQASVAIASDVVTITLCAGDGGAIAGGSVVTVQVGTNATSSGTGSNRVTNPSSVGTYFIRLDGSFGDDGNVWVPIITTGGLPVSAVVPSSGGGGGGGGGLPTDTCTDSVFPTISDVTVTNVTSEGADINWQTDENATSEVDFGLTSSYGTTETGGVTQFHSVSLSRLAEGTVYHFRVRSSDGCPNESFGNDLTFTTLDMTAPVISNIVVSNITVTSATISWTTDESTTGTVTILLGLSSVANYSTTLALSHQVIVSGLLEATTYGFFIEAEDGFNNSTTSATSSFTTLADLPPGNVINLSSVLSGNAVKLQWTLPVESDLAGVRIVWRTDRFPASNVDGTVIDLGLVTSYTQGFAVAGTTYYYAVFVRDQAGQYSSGALTSLLVSMVAPVDDDDEVITDDEIAGDDDTTDHDEIAGDDDTTDHDEIAGDDDDVIVGDDDTIGEGGDGDVCGNLVCEEGETETSCLADCAFEVVLPVSTVGGMFTEIQYLVASDAIELFPSTSGTLSVLPGRSLRVLATIANVPEEASVQWMVGSDRYLMVRTGDLFSSTITTPTGAGRVQMRFESVLEDHSYLLASSWLQLEPFGFTFEIVDGERERLGYARVTLFIQSGGTFSPWESAEYGQLNPQTTPQDGSFAWYVPAGTYYVSASVSGYRPTQTAPRFVTNAIVTEQVELKREPPPIIEVITSPAPMLEKLGLVAGILSQRATDAIAIARGNPQVQQGVTVATPLVLATGIASGLVLSFSFDLFPFLQYLLTSPVLLLWRRRRKSWGVVYDAVSKQPIDLAIVRLYRLADGRLVQSRVTDRYGRYFFLVDPGTYRIGVTKAGFGFPSGFLKDQRQDGGFLDLYHGEPIAVIEAHATIAANVPLDPVSTGAQYAPLRIRAKRVLRLVQHVLASVGILVAMMVLVLRPGVYTGIVFALQIMVYLLVRRLAKPKRKPKGWGIVYDEDTRRPIAQAIVRIFEPVYNKLLATAVTDQKGRYSFLVGPSEYYARFGKEGYLEKEVKPIDLKNAQEPTDIAVDVTLKKTNS